MSEMVERVARALYHAHSRNKPYDILQPEFQRQYEKQARAAIEAMREPTEAMKNAMCEAGPDTNSGEFSWDDAATVWTSGIDAALSPSGEK